MVVSEKVFLFFYILLDFMLLRGIIMMSTFME